MRYAWQNMVPIPNVAVVDQAAKHNIFHNYWPALPQVSCNSWNEFQTKDVNYKLLSKLYAFSSYSFEKVLILTVRKLEETKLDLVFLNNYIPVEI